MEFRYSDLVDPSEYETDGLCDGIPLRRHKDTPQETAGVLRAQADWSKLVAPLVNYQGSLGAKYSMTGVYIPECLPERLEVLSYANEFALLYDDVMETVDRNQKNGETHQILDIFSKEPLKASSGSPDLGAKQIQSQLLSEMLAVDRERTLTTMDTWATYVELSSRRQRSLPFETLEKYLPYRIDDAGERLCFGMVTFGMALTIHDEELDLCKRLTRPGFAAMALANDLYSWEKERDAAEAEARKADAVKAGEAKPVINAIWVLMREHGVTEAEAKELCRGKIRESITEYVRLVEDRRDDVSLSLDLRKYLEAMLYCHSGNLIWSKHSPRYNSEAS